jgi:photosystem II stability/assembly factor-like uncharacterized protein
LERIDKGAKERLRCPLGAGDTPRKKEGAVKKNVLFTLAAVVGIIVFATGGTAIEAKRAGAFTPDITALARNPKAPPEILAIKLADSERSRLYISKDNGATWKLRSDISQYASDVAYDPQNPDTVYVLCADMFNTQKALLQSADRGKTFVSLSLPSGYGANRGRIAVHPSNPKILMIACTFGYEVGYITRAMGILRTTNEGKNWRAINLGFISLGRSEARDIAISKQNPNIAYMCGYTEDYNHYSQVYISRNAGGTWQNITDLDAFSTNGANALAIHPGDPNKVWVADAGDILRTADAGLHWQAQSGTLPYAVEPTALALDALNPLILFAGGGKTCLKSTDGGLKWKAYSKNLSGKKCLRILARGSVVHFATEAGVFRSLDGGLSWKKTL